MRAIKQNSSDREAEKFSVDCKHTNNPLTSFSRSSEHSINSLSHRAWLIVGLKNRNLPFTFSCYMHNRTPGNEQNTNMHTHRCSEKVHTWWENEAPAAGIFMSCFGDSGQTKQWHSLLTSNNTGHTAHSHTNLYILEWHKLKSSSLRTSVFVRVTEGRSWLWLVSNGNRLFFSLYVRVSIYNQLHV